MQERDLSLTPRKEELRNARPIVIPIQFSLTEIKQHFENSLEAIKKAIRSCRLVKQQRRC